MAGAVLVALGGAVAAGCGGTPPCGLRVCDARDPACQDAIAACAACLRQVPPVAVPVTVVGLEEYLEQQSAPTISPEAEQRFVSWNAVLALWGLAPPDLTPAEAARAQAGQVAAFYSVDVKSIVIVDRGYPLDSQGMMETLVHEYAHAIQDARFDIGHLFEQYGGDFDRAQAVGALVEGEATDVEDLAAVGLFGDQPGDVPWDRVYRSWQERARKTALESSLPVLLAPFHFRYPFGSEMVHDAMAAGGWAAADALFAIPPSGTREVLAGFGAPEPASGPWTEDLVDDAVPVLPERFAFQSADRMGAWTAEMLLERAGLPFARAASEGLRGDVLSVYRDAATGGVVGFWRFRFSSIDLATTVAGASGIWQNGRAHQVERDVTLTIASDAGSLLDIPENLAFQPAPPTTAAAFANRPSAVGQLGCAPPADW